MDRSRWSVIVLAFLAVSSAMGKAYTAVCYIRYAGTWEIFHNGQALQKQSASDEGVQVEFEMKDGDLLAASFSRPRTLDGNKVKFAINIKDTPFWWHMRDGKNWKFYQQRLMRYVKISDILLAESLSLPQNRQK